MFCSETVYPFFISVGLFIFPSFGHLLSATLFPFYWQSWPPTEMICEILRYKFVYTGACLVLNVYFSFNDLTAYIHYLTQYFIKYIHPVYQHIIYKGTRKYVTLTIS